MVDFNSLRSLFGARRFDKALKHYEEAIGRAQSAPIEGIETMVEEPANHGLSIVEGRKALKRAAGRSYNLTKSGGPKL